MNDQRAELPTFPGLNNSEAVIGPFMANRDDHSNDDFLEMLMRCQVCKAFYSDVIDHSRCHKCEI